MQPVTTLSLNSSSRDRMYVRMTLGAMCPSSIAETQLICDRRGEVKIVDEHRSNSTPVFASVSDLWERDTGSTHLNS